MDSTTVIRMLTDDGCLRGGDSRKVTINSKHPSKRGKVTIPHPCKDVPERYGQQYPETGRAKIAADRAFSIQE